MLSRPVRCVQTCSSSITETRAMNTNNTQPFMSRIWTLGLLMLAASLGTVALALDTAALDKEVSATLDHFYTLNEENKSLVSHAAGGLGFPSIRKAGDGIGGGYGGWHGVAEKTKVGCAIGGEHGDGALLQKGKSVGSYSTSSASVGLTLGVARHSEVVLFNTKDARDKFPSS